MPPANSQHAHSEAEFRLDVTDSSTGGRTRCNQMIVVTAGLFLGVAIGLAPWTIRNAIVTGGHFVPTTLWMGPSLYDGLNPLANGDSHMEFMQHDSLYQRMSEYDVDQYYRRAAWQWARQNPSQVIWLAWIKMQRYWNLWPNSPQFQTIPVQMAVLSFVIPALIGTVWFCYRWIQSLCGQEVLPLWIVGILLGPIFYFAVLHLLFVSSLRYRLPAEYPLLIAAAYGWRDLFHTFWLSRPKERVIEPKHSV